MSDKLELSDIYSSDEINWIISALQRYIDYKHGVCNCELCRQER